MKQEESNQVLQRGHTLKMPACSYCKRNYEIPRGMTYIQVDGTIHHLCSSKCKRNMLMKRRKVRWILKEKKVKVAPVKEVKAEVKEEVKTETKAKEEVKAKSE